MKRIGIGIDTGGTYTDAVLYDFGSKSILAEGKALTTRRDLSVGILEAFDKLRLDPDAPPKIIALSTTLATNACVENRMGRAKLIFFGGDAKTIDSQGGQYGLPPSSEIIVQPCAATYSRGEVDDVDWKRFVDEALPLVHGLDGVGVVETYSLWNGAVIENRAKTIVKDMTDIPVVCGHELLSELSSLQRGASTLLNASLFPTINAFLASIQLAMRQRGIVAPVMIVRSDGNLMSEEFAAQRPIETLLCGPAASVMGGIELAAERNCVVVDMGGTTTDIAVVQDRVPLRAENGIGVGAWRTFIKGLYINTFGLGGDSAVRYRDGELFLDSLRVVPLCVAASQWPEVTPQLAQLNREVETHTRHLHEFLLPARDVSDNSRFTDEERRLCAALRKGPLILRNAAASIGRDEYSLDATRLVREGVVQISGLTSTDIMHIKGDFVDYDGEASRLGAHYVARNLNMTVEELAESVYAEVEKKLYLNIVKALLENDNPVYRKAGIHESIDEMILASLERVRSGRDGFINVDFRTDYSLVGIGAPIHVFLPRVAKLLGTRCVIPPHSAVANAVGAVVGRIHADSEWEIRADYNVEEVTVYSVFGSETAKTFRDLDEACAYAEAEARREARDEAARRGASGDIAVHCDRKTQVAETKDGSLYLGTRIVAHAVGSSAL